MSECEFCNIELNAMPFICPNCGKEFCSKHKIPKDHECKKIDVQIMADESISNHDKKEQEHSKYIEEEVTIIKRRLSKDKKQNSLAKFFEMLWAYNTVIIILLLIGTGVFLQNTGRYDIKGKMFEIGEKFGLIVPFSKENPVEVNDTLTKIEDVSAQALKTPDMTLIDRIQNDPSAYLGKVVEIDTFVEWSEYKVNSIEFQYRAIDENKKYLYFIFFQNIGFNKYSKYKIIGVLKKEKDTYYIDAKDITKVI